MVLPAGRAANGATLGAGVGNREDLSRVSPVIQGHARNASKTRPRRRVYKPVGRYYALASGLAAGVSLKPLAGLDRFAFAAWSCCTSTGFGADFILIIRFLSSSSLHARAS